jgi:replicative DNA helicase Mcm
MKFSEKDKEKFKELAEHPEIFNLINNSIFPYIHGHEDIKQALAFQLFGGVSKPIDDEISIKGEINILVVSDPGMGMSNLLKGMSKLALRGVYIDCNKSENISTESTLEDSPECSLICIDELVIKPDNVMVLKEALGKKNNFNSKDDVLNILKSRNPVLSTLKPKFGRFDQYKSFEDQIELPPTVLSCFDLMYVVEDLPNWEQDEELAQHVLEFHQNEQINSPIEPLLLKKYIAYAREKIHPKPTDDAIQLIQEFYVKIRQALYDQYLPFLFNVRQLESVIKLSEANARIRLSDEVTTFDVEKIIEFYHKCLRTVGFIQELDEITKPLKDPTTQLMIDNYNY